MLGHNINLAQGLENERAGSGGRVVYVWEQ